MCLLCAVRGAALESSGTYTDSQVASLRRRQQHQQSPCFINKSRTFCMASRDALSDAQVGLDVSTVSHFLLANVNNVSNVSALLGE